MAKMTASERIMMSAMGKEPDRVPVFGIFNDWAWGQLYGRNHMLDYCQDAEKWAKVMVWTCKEMGGDSAVALPDVHPLAEAICEASGLPSPSISWKDFPRTDAHSLYEGDLVNDPAYGNPIIKTMKDAEKLKPADPYKHGRLPVLLKSIELANKELKGDWPVGGMVENALSVGGGLMGWTPMFMAMEKNIALWKKVEDVAIKSSWAFAKAQKKVGAVFAVSHTELPARVGSESFLANPTWMQADWPPELYKRIPEELGLGIAVHACTTGPNEPGIDAWKTMVNHTASFFCAESGGADSLARIKEALAPASVMGNIHPVDIMLHGTPDDVEDACIELIKKCGPGGRFQLGPGCTYSLDVPYENVKAMVDSCEKYGKYPINL
ncbi:uroporphyrinogen decarboxylase family protein [Desulfobacula sp.]|uniref:uroporphyrinogen decarboxylase family protein n=1 Tax=Desulfobacula sp. TaxID=2593537 RepID=UPI0026061861|nr:uroporphyrinogen decarboxylase family protein [Desulfobacula sp.]